VVVPPLDSPIDLRNIAVRVLIVAVHPRDLATPRRRPQKTVEKSGRAAAYCARRFATRPR